MGFEKCEAQVVAVLVFMQDGVHQSTRFNFTTTIRPRDTQIFDAVGTCVQNMSFA